MALKKNITAFFAIGIMGVLGHFLYEWCAKSTLVGFFFPVNESTWEHLKLLFFPTVIYSIFEYIFTKEKPKNYLPAIIISVWCGMITITTLFYTAKGILGFNLDFFNILIYFIAVLFSIYKKNKILKGDAFKTDTAFYIFAAIGLITALAFIFFSFNPPSLGIFTPPVEQLQK